jgi:hypothetical protein
MGLRRAPREGLRGQRHADAVHRARGQAEGAPCTVFGNYLVQILKRPDDGIDRAGGNTKSAADTTIFVNLGNLQWPFFAACRI